MLLVNIYLYIHKYSEKIKIIKYDKIKPITKTKF